MSGPNPRVLAATVLALPFGLAASLGGMRAHAATFKQRLIGT